MQTTVSISWLLDHLDNPSVRVVDGTWHLPTENRNAVAEFEAAHVKGAQFFDIDQISDAQSPLPHMLPSADQFASSVGALGIGHQDTVIIYDRSEVFSAARVWWMFRTFGHDRVFVLNGGFQGWQDAGGAVSNTVNRAISVPYRATLNDQAVIKADDILSSGRSVLDARSPARFRGEAPEPRAGLLPGHIPGATCVFYKSLLTNDHGLKPAAALLDVFAQAGIDPSAPAITSCGSGVTAAVITMALAELGHTDVKLYDGSWTEWGSREDLPRKTGG